MNEQTLTGRQVAWMLVTAPIMGALFAMFLPFIGIALVLWYGGKKLWDVGINAERRLALWMQRRFAA